MSLLVLVLTAAAFFASAISPAAAAGRLVAVRCNPQCAWYGIDPSSGAATELARIPAQFRTFVRPGVAAVSASGEYFWSFPQAPESTVYTYKQAENKTGTIAGIQKGVVSLSWARSTLLAVVNPAANELVRMQLPAGPVTSLLSLGKYNVSGHEYVTCIDSDTGRLFITGDDLTAHSALMRTAHGVFGPPSQVKLTEVTYSGWAMLRMQWNRAARELQAVVYDFATTSSKLVRINPATGDITTIVEFGAAIERAEFGIDHATNTGYVLAVPQTLYSVDLTSGKILSKAHVSPMFGSEIVSMEYV